MPCDVKPFKGKHGKITENMRIKMRELRDEGKTFREVAEMFNVSSYCVQYHLSSRRREYQRERYSSDPEYRERMLKHIKKHQAKKQKSIPLRPGRRWTPEEERLLVELRGQGLSYRKIAESFTFRSPLVLIGRASFLRKRGKKVL